MRTIDATNLGHLQSRLHTFAACMKITRTDSQVFGFTEHDTDLVVGGVTYRANTGILTKSLNTHNTGAPGNTEVDGYFFGEAVTEDDILDGLWDGASVEMFRIDWTDLGAGRALVKQMKLGAVRGADGAYTVQLFDLGQALNRTVGRTLSPFCDAVYGDAKCGVDLDASGNRIDTSVASVHADYPLQAFTIADPGVDPDWFSLGTAEFTSGALQGRTLDIVKYDAATFTVYLLLPVRRAFLVGDDVTLTRGCAHTLDACKAQDNVLRFRGFPWKPSPDKYTQFGFLLTGQR